MMALQDEIDDKENTLEQELVPREGKRKELSSLFVHEKKDDDPSQTGISVDNCSLLMDVNKIGEASSLVNTMDRKNCKRSYDCDVSNSISSLISEHDHTSSEVTTSWSRGTDSSNTVVDNFHISRGWRTYLDEKGNPYNYNFHTGESVWASVDMNNYHNWDGYSGNSQYGSSASSWNPTAALSLIKSQYSYDDGEETKHWGNYYKYHSAQQQHSRRHCGEKSEILLQLATAEDEYIDELMDARNDVCCYDEDDEETIVSTNSSDSSDIGEDDLITNLESAVLRNALAQFSIWKVAVLKHFNSNVMCLKDQFAISSLVASTQAVAALAVEWTRNHLLPRTEGNNN